jgi:hypothetical protein
MARILKAGWIGGIFLAALWLPFASPAAAQVRGAGIAHPTPMRAGWAPISAGGFRPLQRVGTPLQPNFGPVSRVPGLSFNIQALAPADRRDRRRSRFVTPLLWYSPFYSPYEDYAYDEPQPPYDYRQRDYYQPPHTAPQPPQFAPSEASSANAEPQPPPPEVGQFVLVRLDGQVVFAVAFTAVDGRLTYVTREGLRRSFPVAELDKDATRQMNDANGDSIALPN